MHEISQILIEIESGSPIAAERLLPLVYHELRLMAAAQLSHEQPGQTLQATALVHEAYLKLVGSDKTATFANRRHFFRSAAEAMRRILVDVARQKHAVKHGGNWKRNQDLGGIAAPPADPAETLAVHELLDQFADRYPRQAEAVKLRLFLDCSFVEIGELLEVSADTAREDWAFARAWLKREWARDGHKSVL
jgi:RNA polymerase sigma factor (TIGR02999 family)